MGLGLLPKAKYGRIASTKYNNSNVWRNDGIIYILNVLF